MRSAGLMIKRFLSLIFLLILLYALYLSFVFIPFSLSCLFLVNCAAPLISSNYAKYLAHKNYNPPRRAPVRPAYVPNTVTTSLVVWGSLTTIFVGFKRYKIVLAMLGINRYLQEVLFGCMLSDGHLRRYASGTTFTVGLKLDHCIYIIYLFFLFSHICSSYPFLTVEYKHA
jgi:hypothetical protein